MYKGTDDIVDDEEKGRYPVLFPGGGHWWRCPLLARVVLSPSAGSDSDPGPAMYYSAHMDLKRKSSRHKYMDTTVTGFVGGRSNMSEVYKDTLRRRCSSNQNP